MNPKRLRDALNTISLGFAEAAEALNDTPEVARTASGGPAAGVVPSSPAPARLSETLDEAMTTVLGECPVHFTPWELKEAGVSKAGKPYGAFWKWNGKNADGTWCSKKPTLEWVRTHDPEQVPF